MDEPVRPPGGLGAVAVLLAAGALGFQLGYSRFPDWQVPVETAQVLAGVVRYPEDTPFFLYHVRLWTVLHQLCALALLAGVSEITLSKLISGVLGMLSLQALAIYTFAFSRRVLLSIGTALVIFVSQVTDAGAVYPIFLVGVPFTYGVIGLGLMTLVAGLIGAGLHRAGALLLGLAPAVHPALGAWLWVVIGAGMVVDRQFRQTLFAARRPFVTGLALTLVSLGVHQWMAAGVPATSVETSRIYFDAFVTFWDGHRRPVKLTEIAVTLNAAALAVSSIWLLRCRGGLGPSAGLLLRFVQVSAAIALALVPVTWISPRVLPEPLVILMPGRLLNINAFTFTAMLVGLLASSVVPWLRLLAPVTAWALLLNRASLLWRLVPAGSPAAIAGLAPQWMAIVAAATAVAGVMADRRTGPRLNPVTQARTRPVAIIAAAAFAAASLSAAAVAFTVAEHRGHIFFDRTNNPVLAAAAQADGLLLTAGNMHLVQLRTRRPQLIDTGALDTAAYMPHTAPTMARILKEIYGIDLFNPPLEARHAGLLPPESHRELWQRYTADDWRAIRRVWRVTQVLTPSDWQLDLPIVMGDRRHLLYAIPE